MSDLRKAAEMALEALSKVMLTSDKGVACENAKKALRQALAQPEQEPVAHLWECIGRWTAMTAHDGKDANLAPPDWLVDAVKAATAPPKREWVGLTDDDKQEAFDETQEASGGFWEFADYLEAKLKEKNT